jgi:hypothetical protein
MGDTKLNGKVALVAGATTRGIDDQRIHTVFTLTNSRMPKAPSSRP